MNLSAILIAGGKSTRMGKDKRFIILKNKNIPLWQQAINLLKNFTSDIIISANSMLLNNINYPIIPDRIPDIGPIGGLYSCLPQIKNSAAIVIPVDMPLLQEQTIESLINDFDGKSITIAKHNEKIEPLVGIYPKAALKDLEKNIMARNYKIRELFKSYPTKFVSFEREDFFLNINRPKDLIELDKYITLL